MKARLYLAALDWNTQTRVELKHADGTSKEDTVFSKRRGAWVKRLRYKVTSGNHLPNLMKMIMGQMDSPNELPKMKKPNLPKHVAKQPKPNPEDIQRRSRFGQS